MLLPSVFGENLFDGFWDFPDFSKDFDSMNKKLYGHHSTNIMKTDIRENEDGYEMIVDLPGFTKDEVKVELQDGYLTISAAKDMSKDKKEKDGTKYIRRERYYGSTQRSWYVGDIDKSLITADFKHGILTLNIPKPKKVIENKEDNLIQITG